MAHPNFTGHFVSTGNGGAASLPTLSAFQFPERE
jgi:hypothetical protein